MFSAKVDNESAHYFGPLSPQRDVSCQIDMWDSFCGVSQNGILIVFGIINSKIMCIHKHLIKDISLCNDFLSQLS